MGFQKEIIEKNKKILFDIDNMTRDRSLDRLKLSSLTGKEKISRIETILSKSNTKRVLEIGCGKAKALNLLAEKYKDIEFYGIDLSPPNSELPNLKLRKMDAHNLDFEEGYFDLTFSFFTFAYMIDKIKGLKEVYRTLNKEGEGIIHLSPKYFYPDGKEIIPSNFEEGDIIWDESYKYLLIKKMGKNPDFLNKKYLGNYPLNWDREYLGSNLSLYKKLPPKEQLLLALKNIEYLKSTQYDPELETALKYADK